ncbi:MAG: PEGA domain-containing protein [Deltaproteobacteria bacterium]
MSITALKRLLLASVFLAVVMIAALFAYEAERLSAPSWHVTPVGAVAVEATESAPAAAPASKPPVAPIRAPTPPPRPQKIEPVLRESLPTPPAERRAGVLDYGVPSPAPLERATFLVVLTAPSGMVAATDGRVLGRTPLVHRLPRGTERVDVELSGLGYRAKSVVATANASGRLYVNARMEPR